jgi:hypothetical protein
LLMCPASIALATLVVILQRSLQEYKGFAAKHVVQA